VYLPIVYWFYGIKITDKIVFEKMYVIPLSRLNSTINEVRKHENSVLGITTLATNKE
jgi:hypothetical protein